MGDVLTSHGGQNDEGMGDKKTKMEMVGLTVTMIIVGMLLREISLQVSE